MKIQLKFTIKMLNTLPGIIPGGISVQDFSVITKTDITESKKIFQDFSKALDNSLRITKMIMIGCAVLFLTSLFL